MQLGSMLNPIGLTASLSRRALFEGPYWSAARRALCWVDVYSKKIFMRNRAGSAIPQCQVPGKVSALIEASDSRLLLTGQRRRRSLDPKGMMRRILSVAAQRPKSCACAGEGVETSVVTSATIDMNNIAADTLAGHAPLLSVGLPWQSVKDYGRKVLGQSASTVVGSV